MTEDEVYAQKIKKLLGDELGEEAIETVKEVGLAAFIATSEALLHPQS